MNELYFNQQNTFLPQFATLLKNWCTFSFKKVQFELWMKSLWC